MHTNAFKSITEATPVHTLIDLSRGTFAKAIGHWPQLFSRQHESGLTLQEIKEEQLIPDSYDYLRRRCFHNYHGQT